MISGSITNISMGAEVGSNRSSAGHDGPIGCRRNQKQFTSMLITEFFLRVAFLKKKWPLCYFQGLPRWHSSKESACNAGNRHRFLSWVGKIPWRRKQQPTPVFLPRESLWTEKPGHKEADVTWRLKQQQHNLSSRHITKSEMAFGIKKLLISLVLLLFIQWCLTL